MASLLFSVRIMTTSIHVTALDSVVNSLFTLAVHIGLAWNPLRFQQHSPKPRQPMFANSKIAEDLIKFHVYLFNSFLFSSLLALALKQAIKISKSHAFNIHVSFRGSEIFGHVDVNKTLLRVGMLVLGAGSVAGCVFLMLALVDVVQIKVGTLACGSWHAFAAVVPLVILVSLALLIYVCVGLYAFTR